MRRLALALVALAAFAAGAQAQPITQQTFSGNECWEAGQGPGGPGSFVCSSAFRGGTNNLPLTIAGSFTVGASSANTTPNSTVALVEGGTILVTAQPAAATITLPPNPLADGITVGYCNVTSGAFSAAAVTFAANSNQTLAVAATLTTQAAGSCTVEQWNLANTTWYRIR
jgi:hypothetical protein